MMRGLFSLSVRYDERRRPKTGRPAAVPMIKIGNNLPRLPQERPEVEVLCIKLDFHGLA